MNEMAMLQQQLHYWRFMLAGSAWLNILLLDRDRPGIWTPFGHWIQVLSTLCDWK